MHDCLTRGASARKQKINRRIELFAEIKKKSSCRSEEHEIRFFRLFLPQILALEIARTRWNRSMINLFTNQNRSSRFKGGGWGLRWDERDELCFSLEYPKWRIDASVDSWGLIGGFEFAWMRWWRSLVMNLRGVMKFIDDDRKEIHWWWLENFFDDDSSLIHFIS